MKKKDYISPQVRQYRIDGPLVPFASSGKGSIKVDGKDEIEIGGDDKNAQESDSRKFDGWSWDD